MNVVQPMENDQSSDKWSKSNSKDGVIPPLRQIESFRPEIPPFRTPPPSPPPSPPLLLDHGVSDEFQIESSFESSTTSSLGSIGSNPTLGSSQIITFGNRSRHSSETPPLRTPPPSPPPILHFSENLKSEFDENNEIDTEIIQKSFRLGLNYNQEFLDGEAKAAADSRDSLEEINSFDNTNDDISRSSTDSSSLKWSSEVVFERVPTAQSSQRNSKMISQLNSTSDAHNSHLNKGNNLNEKDPIELNGTNYHMDLLRIPTNNYYSSSSTAMRQSFPQESDITRKRHSGIAESISTPNTRKHASISSSAIVGNVFTWKRGQLLGVGAFGKVYLGLNTNTGELFAVKELVFENSLEAEAHRSVLSFRQEIELMRSLRHENIVRYLGTQVTDTNTICIFLEFVSGGSLSSVLSKFGPLTESVIRVYTKQVLTGLEYLHKNGIIHRDIKGANILVDPAGTVKLTDFGCAKAIRGLQGSNIKSLVGTPYWMAPEVIRNEGYGRSADIWSLGCTIVEMACGRPPWSQEFTELAAAMYHIASSNEIPHIPDSLSSDGHDFLLLCFRRESRERSDASTLLSHVFIRQPLKVNRNIAVGDHSTESIGPDERLSRNEKASSSLDPLLDEKAKNPHTKNLGDSSESMVSTDTMSKVSPHSLSLLAFGIVALPSNLLLCIFSFLPIECYRNVALVCKGWRLLMEDDMIWRYRTLRRWNNARREETETWYDLFNRNEAHDRRWFHSELVSQKWSRGISGGGGGSHKKGINAVILSTEMVITASDDKRIKLWDLKTQKKLKSLKGHDQAVTCISLLLRESNHGIAGSGSITEEPWVLLSGGLDRRLKLWSLERKKCLWTPTETHHDGITAVQIYSTGVAASASLDGTVRLWDLHAGRLVTTLTGGSPILALSWSDSNLLICGGTDRILKMYDLRTKDIPHVFIGHNAEITCLQCDRAGRVVISGSRDCTVREWDLTSGVCRWSLRDVHQDGVRCVAFDNNKVISGGEDKLIKFWSRHSDIYQSARSTKILRGHTGAVCDLRFDQNKIISVGKDKLIRLWTCTE